MFCHVDGRVGFTIEFEREGEIKLGAATRMDQVTGDACLYRNLQLLVVRL